MSDENYKFMLSEAFYELKHLVSGGFVAYSSSGGKALGPTPDEAVTLLRSLLSHESKK